jgi:hypothetical protein
MAGTYKLTGYTLWRSEEDGKDYPARMVIPKAKLLSAITINQAATGDPTVFPFKFMILKSPRSTTMIEYNIESDAPIN